MTDQQTLGDDALYRLFEEEWRERIEDLGDEHLWGSPPPDRFLPDVSPDAWEARGRRWQVWHDRAEAFDPESLSEKARVDRAVFLDQLTTLLERVRFRDWERPANADEAFWVSHTGATRRPLASAAEAEDYLDQLRQVPRWFAQHVENMRAGVARGFAPPKVTMQGREAPVRAVAEAPSARETPYYERFAAFAGGGSADLLSRAEQVIDEHVLPAYRELLGFLVDEYLPKLPETLGASDATGGRDYYLSQLREFTTTDLDPEEIHELGLESVAAIRAEMEAVAKQTGHGTVDDLIRTMRTDPQFYPTTKKELIASAAYTCKRFDGIIHEYFGRVPLQRFGIIEPPADLAPFYTFGRGSLDAYTLNTFNLPARPLYSIPALTLHEAAPGHCFQIALANENDDHPMFRRRVYISAYGEGWALYTERLGVEMGMYETPYEHMGMLSFQMWRAARLVIDTGLHAKQWTREQAQAYLRDNTAIAEHEIVTEIDRYISWPGQACAYYLGQLAILGLRHEAEEALGERFDIRWFHDLVLSFGSVPIAVLEESVRRSIAAQQSERAA